MSDKLMGTTELKAKYTTLKTEVQTKLNALNNELVKDELSSDILAKKDELVDLLIQKYSSTKATAIREATEIRTTVSEIVKTAMKAKPAAMKDVVDDAAEKESEEATA